MIRLLVLFIGLGCAATAAAQIPNYVPQNGLVGWWPFNGNANDESGNGNHGIVYGATLAPNRFGVPNKSYQFQVSGAGGWGAAQQRIVVPNPTIPQINSFTMSSWVYMTPKPAPYDDRPQTIMGRWDGNGQAVFRNQVGNSSNYYSGQTFLPSDLPLIVSCPIIPFSDWTFYSISYDGSVLRRYINAIQIDSFSINAQINYSTADLTFGELHMPNGHWLFFNGRMSELGYWSRALSQQEITVLYNSCQLFATQPLNQSVNQNQTAKITATSPDPASTYQWQSDLGFGFQNLNNVGQYSGVNTDTLFITNVGQNNNNQPFRCIVTVGTCSDTSQTAILNVCPALTGQPASQTVAANQNVQFSVTSSDPSATYQWQSDVGFGFQNLNNVSQYSGVNTGTLSVSNVSASNNNQPFRCIVSASSCTDTSQIAILSISGSSSIETDFTVKPFSVFPNPAHTQVTIHFGKYVNKNGLTVKIVNALGQTRYVAPIAQASSIIDLSLMASDGIYYVQILDKKKEILETIKLVAK
jgi:hypothetical protein